MGVVGLTHGIDHLLIGSNGEERRIAHLQRVQDDGFARRLIEVIGVDALAAATGIGANKHRHPLLSLNRTDEADEHEEQAARPLYIDNTLFHCCGML